MTKLRRNSICNIKFKFLSNKMTRNAKNDLYVGFMSHTEETDSSAAGYEVFLSL
jgi:hypothetical protein